MTADLEDVANGLVSPLRLQHDRHMPDVRYVAHVEHMPRCDLAEKGLRSKRTESQSPSAHACEAFCSLHGAN